MPPSDRTEQRPPFPPTHAIVVAATLVVVVALKFGFSEHIHGLSLTPMAMTLTSSLVMAAIFILPALGVLGRAHVNPLDAWFPCRFALRDAIIGFTAAAAFALLNGIAIQYLIRSPLTGQSVFIAACEKPTEQIVLITAIAGIPAVAEEIFFRGALYPLLRRRLGPPSSAAASAALFALLHLPSVERVLPAFLLGCVSGLMYEYSRSLFAPILMHLGLNLGLVFFLMDHADAAQRVPAVLLWIGFAVMNVHLFMFGKSLYRK